MEYKEGLEDAPRDSHLPQNCQESRELDWDVRENHIPKTLPAAGFFRSWTCFCQLLGEGPKEDVSCTLDKKVIEMDTCLQNTSGYLNQDFFSMGKGAIRKWTLFQ